MASISKLLPATEYIGSNSAYISFIGDTKKKPEDGKPNWETPSYPSVPDTATSRSTSQTRTWTIYSGEASTFSYSWTFYRSASPRPILIGSAKVQSNKQQQVSSLLVGQQNSIYGVYKVSLTGYKVTVTRTWTQTRTPGKPAVPGSGDNPGTPAVPPGPWIDGTPSDRQNSSVKVTYDYQDTTTSSISIYTKPSPFSWSVTSNGYIDQQLSANKWNQLCDQVGKRSSWINQSNSYNIADGYHVSAGDYMSAQIYNGLAGKLNLNPNIPSGLIKNIEAEHIKALVRVANSS